MGSSQYTAKKVMNGTTESSAPSEVPPEESGLRPAARSEVRTPLYEASNAARYDRQLLVREIQATTGRHLIAYVAGVEAAIDRDDTLGFADLLHNVPAQVPVDLLLHTPGGDIDAAEKLVHMMRKRIGDAPLRVVVPDFAKSAGTLMALGSDAVVMSDTSELGPIDPQIVRCDVNGNRIAHSIFNYLHAYEGLRAELAANPDSIPARMMLGKLDPETVKLFEAVRDRARSCAETFLKRWMFNKVPGNWSKLVSELLDVKRWQTHGQMISSDDARDLGLTVEYLSQNDALWSQYWRLYCRQRVAITPRQKLFESDHVCLTLEAGGGGQAGSSDARGSSLAR